MAASNKSVQTMRLIETGFTEAQAGAIADSVDAAAGNAVEALTHELARWHLYLACYMIIEIGIVLLVILITQAASPPVRTLAGTSVRPGTNALLLEGGTYEAEAGRHPRRSSHLEPGLGLTGPSFGPQTTGYSRPPC